MSNSQFSPPTILIVDDSQANRHVLTKILGQDYRIEAVASGYECLRFVEKRKPELILMDIEMPGESGYETTAKLKTNPETTDIPIIFVTGRTSDEDEERGLKLGAVDFISKPFKAGILSARVRTHVLLKQQQDHLMRLAMRDQLTGTFNRHYLVDAAEEKIALARRHRTPLSLIVLDLDHFKKINDNYGHNAGDLILKKVGELLMRRCAQNFIVSRFGGEEFVLVADMPIANAHYQSEILRHRISELNPQGIHVTTSVGISQLRSDEDNFRDFFKRADEALYQAKANGRNCIVSAEDMHKEEDTDQLTASA